MTDDELKDYLFLKEILKLIDKVDWPTNISIYSLEDKVSELLRDLKWSIGDRIVNEHLEDK